MTLIKVQQHLLRERRVARKDSRFGAELGADVIEHAHELVKSESLGQIQL